MKTMIPYENVWKPWENHTKSPKHQETFGKTKKTNKTNKTIISDEPWADELAKVSPKWWFCCFFVFFCFSKGFFVFLGFGMVFLWFSYVFIRNHGFHMVFLWFPVASQPGRSKEHTGVYCGKARNWPWLRNAQKLYCGPLWVSQIQPPD